MNPSYSFNGLGCNRYAFSAKTVGGIIGGLENVRLGYATNNPGIAAVPVPVTYYEFY